MAIVVALLFLLSSGCAINNVDNAEGAKVYFDSAHVLGCFGLYDNNRGAFTIYNRERYLKSFTPGETFDVVTALVGLETGKLFNEKTLIGSQTMEDAFRSGNTPYFQELARRIGRDTLVKWIDTLSYGNKNVEGPIDSIWLNDRLTISSDEQLGLIKRMYFRQLSFQQRTQDVMKSVMLREKTPDYTLSYVTGSGRNAENMPVGWVIGWIEENRHPYFYVINFQENTSGADIPGTGVGLLRKLLTAQGFFKGLK